MSAHKPDLMDDLLAATTAAANAPEVGMAFHEMYSYWVFVTSVTEHVVQVVKGGGHPSWFPECGVAVNVPRADFPASVKYEYLADKRYEVDGWGARAEGLSIEALEKRVADGRGGGDPS